MDNSAEIMKLIEAGLQQDSVKVLNYSMLLITKLESKGDLNAAERLRKIIKNSKTLALKAKDCSQIINSPVDSESRLPLAEIKQYSLDSIFLSVSDIAKESIEEYISIIDNAGELSEKGIKINRNLLLYGPPGVGKTQAAKYISARTQLPLVTVRIDGLVSSYLGSTSKNIRMLFEFVEKVPCILFLDEFDAIAKMRDDANELGELKRVVNTLLQNIDSIESKVPVIAATNHEHLLDSAVWRRFDYKIVMDFPDQEQRMCLLRKYLENLEIDEKKNNMLVSMTNKFSCAEIEIFCDLIKTNLVLNKKEILTEKLLFDFFIKYAHRRSRADNQYIPGDEKSKVLLLKSFREQDRKSFDYRTISQMLGVSLGKTSNLLNEGDINVNG